jgi:thiol peroxidase
MSERTVSFRDKPFALGGTEIRAGDRAPGFQAVDAQNILNVVKPLEDSKGKVVLFTSVFSLDTPVCETQTQRFNEEASKLGEGVAIYILTMDLPPSAKRFCDSAKVDRVKVVTDYRWAEFAEKYGFLIKDLRMLQRGNVVVGRDGVVTYVEHVPAVKDQPNYEATLEALKKAL